MKTILVDCFDTIMKRKISPRQVYKNWATCISGFYPILSSDEWFNLYESSEKCLRERAEKQKIDEILEVDLYLDMLLKIKLFELGEIEDEKAFVDTCKKIYYEEEKKALYINNNVVNLLQKYKKAGLKIYCVSDFYCSKQQLLDWFKIYNINHLFDDIFVSCDYLKTKHSGQLYEHVLSVLKLKASDCLMIGDNEYSDGKMSKKYGIKYRKIKNKKIKNKIKNKKIKIDKELKKIFKKNSCINYENYAFPLYLFCSRLYDECVNKGIKDLFFLSREGQFLKKLFEHFCRDKDIRINTHYLLVSRNSTFLASCGNLEDETFNKVFKERSRMSVKDFLITLSFDDETIGKITSTMNNYDVRIEDFKDSQEFQNLKVNKVFVEKYEECRNKQRELFKKYLNSFNVDLEREGLNIVDVGWKGTMQDNIKTILENVSVTGYYIGLLDEGALVEKNKKFGLLYSTIPFYNSTKKLFSFNIYRFEQILKANHNKICSYIEKDGEINFEFEKSKENLFYEKYMKIFQDNIFFKFDKISNYYDKKGKDNIVEEVGALYRKMLIKTSFNDYNLIATCLDNHYDSFALVGYARFKHSFLRYIYEQLKTLKTLLFCADYYN